MPCIEQLNKDIGEDAAFRFVFEGTDFLKNLTEGLDPKECEYMYIIIILLLLKKGPKPVNKDK